MVVHIGLKVMTKTLVLKKKLSKLKCLFKYPAGHMACPAGVLLPRFLLNRCSRLEQTGLVLQPVIQ